jgi:hypothetical protein
MHEPCLVKVDMYGTPAPPCVWGYEGVVHRNCESIMSQPINVRINWIRLATHGKFHACKASFMHRSCDGVVVLSFF